MTQQYFDSNGNYGDAENLIICHTDSFTEEDWAMIKAAPNDLRMQVVELILSKKQGTQTRTLKGL